MIFRKLRADEIDCRIGSITEKGVTLLLYKDARCDMNILDETFGAFGWQRHHSRENANCTVSVYDAEKNEWIEKEDTGTESNTEAEKGLASDSFKRACFNWGIGRELYTAPRIFIPADSCSIKDRKCYDRFKVVEIAYSDTGSINKLIIANVTRGVDVFSYPKKRVPVRQPVEAPDGYFYCEVCGDVIKEFRTNGKVISQKEFAENTLQKYGRQLCKECARNLKNEVPTA